MKKLEHPNIVAFYDLYEDPNHNKIYLAMEYVAGGELFDEIVNRGNYSEADSSKIMRQILEAAQYMHNHEICHRDLKPENILLCGPNKDIVKVTDFGVSKDVASGALATFVGTPDYMAPEVLKGLKYTKSVDIWSIGVISFVLLAGCPPFTGNSDIEIFQNILLVKYTFDDADWNGISDQAMQFVRSLLVLDPDMRLTATQLLNHPWILKASSVALPQLEKFKRGMTTYSDKRKQTKKPKKKS